MGNVQKKQIFMSFLMLHLVSVFYWFRYESFEWKLRVLSSESSMVEFFKFSFSRPLKTIPSLELVYLQYLQFPCQSFLLLQNKNFFNVFAASEDRQTMTMCWILKWFGYCSLTTSMLDDVVGSRWGLVLVSSPFHPPPKDRSLLLGWW